MYIPISPIKDREIDFLAVYVLELRILVLPCIWNNGKEREPSLSIHLVHGLIQSSH